MIRKIAILAAVAWGYVPVAQATNTWIDFTSGTTQPFVNGSNGQGTVSYTDNMNTVVASSMNSPDTNFPFTNPIKYLRVSQPAVDAFIEFTFSGVAPDAGSLFTLGNLRPGNRYIVTAFDQNNAPISLVTWTNYGEYRLFATDTAPDTWNPNTGVMVGNGTNQDNGMNLFFGLTSSVRRIHVDFDNTDGGFEVLDFAIAGGGSVQPPPVPMAASWSLAVLAALMTLIGSFVLASRRPQLQPHA